MNSPKNVVLDAWALLAMVFKEEPAAGEVKNLLEAATGRASGLHLSWINLGEVYYMISRKKGLPLAEETLADLLQLPMKVHEPAKADVLAAARIKSAYRLSYADAFAISLAQKLNAEIWTGDPEIVAIEKIVAVKPLHRMP